MRKRLTQLWLPSVVLSLAATLAMTAVSIDAKSTAPVIRAEPARIIVIIDDSFEGDVSRGIANYIASQSNAKVDVVEADNGERLGGYPFLVSVDANGQTISSHKGLKNVFGYIESVSVARR